MKIRQELTPYLQFLSDIIQKKIVSIISIILKKVKRYRKKRIYRCFETKYFTMSINSFVSF